MAFHQRPEAHLGTGEGGDPVVYKVLAGRVINERRRHQEVARQLQFAVILHHPRKPDLGDACNMMYSEIQYRACSYACLYAMHACARKRRG